MNGPSRRGLPDGVVFDCDGTIADTESISDRAWTQTLQEYGYRPTPQDFAAVIGHPFPQNFRYYSARVDLGDEQVFRARLRERFLTFFERDLDIHVDAVEVIRALHGAKIPVAVASSSGHQHVVRVLERASLRDQVTAIVGADDVARHKPDPLPYLAAATAIGVAPGDCTAVEDTSVGLASALAAGMFTVGVVRSHGTPAGLADAHRVVDRLSLEALEPTAAYRARRVGR